MKNITKGFKIKPKDKKRLIFAEKRDYEILHKIYLLEEKKLSPQDRNLICFLRTQLKDDWRKPLLKVLNKISKKYKP